MGNLLFSLLILTSIQVSSLVQDIEKAFLQNNAKLIYSLLPEKGHINLSFPEPVSFSDQLSYQQTYYQLKNIFSSFQTFEFYSEDQHSALDGQSSIIKTRWSFRDKRNRNQYVFHVFFYLIKNGDPNKADPDLSWKIIEIKAEKL